MVHAVFIQYHFVPDVYQLITCQLFQNILILVMKPDSISFLPCPKFNIHLAYN